MSGAYVHGYHPRESERLQDQAGTLVDLLHSDTTYPAKSMVLEAGCGVGAQTVTLARNSPGARITAVDISAVSLKEAEAKVEAAGLANVRFLQADIFALPFDPESFDHVFVCFVLEHLSSAIEAGIVEPEILDAGIRALHRTAEADGVFCYTFFKGVGEKAPCAARESSGACARSFRP